MPGASMGGGPSKQKIARAKAKEAANIKEINDYAATKGVTLPTNFYRLIGTQGRNVDYSGKDKNLTSFVDDYIKDSKTFWINAVREQTYGFVHSMYGVDPSAADRPGLPQNLSKLGLQESIKQAAEAGVPVAQIESAINSGQSKFGSLIQDDKLTKAFLKYGVPVALSFAIPGIGSQVGGLLTSSGVLAGVSAATADIIGTAITSTMVQMAQGASFEDALKKATGDAILSAGTSSISGQITTAVNNPIISNALISAGTTGARTLLEGGSAEDAIKNAVKSGGVSMGVATVIKTIPDYGKLPVPAQDAVKNAVTSALSGKDITDALVSGAITSAGQAFKNVYNANEATQKELGRDLTSDEASKFAYYTTAGALNSEIQNLVVGEKSLKAIESGKDTFTYGGKSFAVSTSELEKYFKTKLTDAGMNPTADDVNAALVEYDKTKDAKGVASLIADSRSVDTQEVKDAFARQGVYNLTPQQIERYVQTGADENTVIAEIERAADPLATNRDELNEIYKTVLNVDPTKKEADAFVGKTEADVLAAITRAKDTSYDLYEQTYGKAPESSGDVLKLLKDISDDKNTAWSDLDKAIEAENKITESSNFGEAYAAARAAFGPNATFTWTNPKTGNTDLFTTESETEKIAKKSTDLITQASSNQKAVNYVKSKLVDNIQDPNFNPADLNKKSMSAWVDTYAKATPSQQAAMLKGPDSMTFTVIDTMLRQTQQYNPTGSVPAARETSDKMIASPVTNYWGVAKTGANLAAADLAALGVRGVDLVSESLGYNNETTTSILKLLDEDKQKQLGKLVGYEKSSAGGVASGITSAAAYLSGGRWASVAANTGVAANNAWMEGEKAGLGIVDNASRTAVMATMEMVGETLGIAGLDKIMKGIPVGGTVDDMIAATKRFGAGLLNEETSELLTTTMQFAADKFANFGLAKDSTVEDFAQAMKDTVVATAAAVGSAGSISTATSNLNKALDTVSQRDSYYYDSNSISSVSAPDSDIAESTVTQELLRGTRDDIVQQLRDSGLTDDQAMARANQAIGKEFVNTSALEAGLEETDINQVIGKNVSGQDITLSELLGATVTGSGLTGNPVINEDFSKQILAMEDSDVTNIFKNAVDPYYVSIQEAKNAFANEGIFNPTEKELADYAGSKIQIESLKSLSEYADPRAVTEAEVKQFFKEQGYTPTQQEINNFVNYVIENNVDTTTNQNVNLENNLNTQIQENLNRNQNLETTISQILSTQYDPLATLPDEIRAVYKDIGYEPSEEEINKFAGSFSEEEQTNLARKYGQQRLDTAAKKRRNKYGQLMGEGEEQTPEPIMAPTADVFYYGKDFSSSPQQISESGQVAPYRPVDMSSFGPDYDAMLGLPKGTLSALPIVQAAGVMPPTTGIAPAPNTGENVPTTPPATPTTKPAPKTLEELLSTDTELTEEDLMRILQEHSRELVP